MPITPNIKAMYKWCGKLFDYLTTKFFTQLHHTDFASWSIGQRFFRPVTRSFDVFFDQAWTDSWANNEDAGDLRRYRANYDVIVMFPSVIGGSPSQRDNNAGSVSMSRDHHNDRNGNSGRPSPLHQHGLTLTHHEQVVTSIIKCGMKLLIVSHTPTVQLGKFGMNK